MKIAYFFLLTFTTAILSSCSADIGVPIGVDTAAAPADSDIAAAERLIEKAPDSAAGYTQLAVVYIRKARATSDFALNEKAETAVNKALEISPNDVWARKLQASLHLTFHRFGKGLELASQLQKEFPDDPFVYGLLTDANAELGNYDQAVDAAQKMVDLRPNSSSYARVAHMRSLHGDHAGAVEMFKIAARTTDPQDKEAQAWCLTQLGKELWNNGKYAEADKVFDEALGIMPDYQLASLAKAKTLASLEDHEGTVKLLTSLADWESDPDANVLLSHLYSKKGDPQKSAEYFNRGEAAERENLGTPAEQQHVAMLWADHEINLPKALEIAQEEYSRQKDIYTSDLLAWCLYKNGRFEEAKKLSGKSLVLKTNDARLYYHAGMIEKSLGNQAAARDLLNKALKLNPQFDIRQADLARKALAELKG